MQEALKDLVSVDEVREAVKRRDTQLREDIPEPVDDKHCVTVDARVACCSESSESFGSE